MRLDSVSSSCSSRRRFSRNLFSRWKRLISRLRASIFSPMLSWEHSALGVCVCE
jgi:hypothetical protein